MKDDDDDFIDLNSLKQKKSEGFFTRITQNYLKQRKGKDFKLKTREEKQFLFYFGFFNGIYYGTIFGVFFAYYFKFRYKMKIEGKLFFIFPLIFSSIMSTTFGIYSVYLFDKDKILEEVNAKEKNKLDKSI